MGGKSFEYPYDVIHEVVIDHIVCFIIVVKIFPIVGVNAMGRKLLGELGSSIAEVFPRSLTTAVFHWSGKVRRVQHVVCY